MKFCFICGEATSPYAKKYEGRHCPQCFVYYCPSCSTIVNNCYMCGTEPVMCGSPNKEQVDLEKLWTEFSWEERREHPRRECTEIVEYISANSRDKSIKLFNAVTKDVSKSGACIYTFIAHKKGQRLRIIPSSALYNCSIAEVRWSQHIKKNIYKVGLMFIK